MHRPLRSALVACLTLLAPGALAATGTGPGGYTWKDCAEPDGPACDYVVTAASDGATGLCSDEIYSPPGVPAFSFPFYGTAYTRLWVSANGVVYLSSPPAADDVNAALTGLEGSATIAPLWDDWAMDNDDELAFICLDPGCSNSGPLSVVESFRLGSGTDAGVAYQDIEWFDTAKHRPTCSEPETVTFAVRLYADGRILFNYLDAEVVQPAETDFGISSTIGVSRGASGEYTQVSFDSAQIPSVPYAILFIPPCTPVSCDAITAPSDACEGDPVHFDAVVSGGTPPFDMSWDFDGETVPDASGNPVDQVIPPGTVTVTLTVTDACTQPAPTTCSMTKRVTVHPTPVPIVTPSGSTTFCGADGESVNLIADAGYADYQWQRDGIDVPAGITRTLNADTSGTYVVRVTDSFGCKGSSAPVVVNADDCTAACTPLLCDAVDVRPDPACEGSQVTLTAIFSGGEGAITVGWDLDGDTTPDVTGNPLRRVFPAGASGIWAIVTDSCALPGPQSCSKPVTVNVNATPSPVVTADGPLAFCGARGESVTLDAGPGWASYEWRLGAIPLAPGQTFVADMTGAYTVVVTDAAGCSGESAPVFVDSGACASTCPVLSCGLITATPPTACEGDTQSLFLEITGGVAPTGVAWDLDGDTTPDAVGNPVDVTLPAGTNAVHAVAADSCADPAPQSCEAFLGVTVNVPASAIGEVSGAGDPPLLVLTKAARLEVESEAAATSYHAYVDAIGSWWAPSDATGRQCGLTPAGPGARAGTVLLDVTLPLDSWVVIVGANSCGEGPAGSSSTGTARETGAGWTPCGP